MDENRPVRHGQKQQSTYLFKMCRIRGIASGLRNLTKWCTLWISNYIPPGQVTVLGSWNSAQPSTQLSTQPRTTVVSQQGGKSSGWSKIRFWLILNTRDIFLIRHHYTLLILNIGIQANCSIVTAWKNLVLCALKILCTSMSKTSIERYHATK